MNDEPSTIVLVGSDEPIAAPLGRAWRAVDGEPAYRLVLEVAPGEPVPDPATFGSGAAVWIGTRIDSLRPAGDPAQAQVLLVVGQEPAPGHEVEFNAWMDEEHVPGLGAVPGTLSAHRYHSPTGSPAYFAVYHLRDAGVNATPQWKAVGQSPLSAAMKPHSRKRIRGLYVPAEPAVQ